jgi:hypothetical protein
MAFEQTIIIILTCNGQPKDYYRLLRFFVFGLKMLEEMSCTEVHRDQAILCNGTEWVDVFLWYHPCEPKNNVKICYFYHQVNNKSSF